MPSTLDASDQEDIDPAEKVMELIENVRNSFDRLSNLQMLEVLTAWVENPQDCCYEELDLISERLGFSYEEIDDEYILVLPSPSGASTFGRNTEIIRANISNVSTEPRQITM